MPDTTARPEFVAAQLATLEAHDFLVVGVPRPPFDAVQVQRGEDGSLVLEVGAREHEPFAAEATAALGELGFRDEEGRWVGPTVADAAVAGQLVEAVLDRVFGAVAGTPVDVRHGTNRDEVEAARKVEEMRRRIEPVLTELVGANPTVDDDGDYVVDLGTSRVFVAPRALPGRPPIVRVFAITNAGVTMGGDLGMFLARLNFTLMFGRFSVDVDHQAVWFDETLLGDHTTDDELRFTVGMVASTAAEWDRRIAQLFGGTVRQAEEQRSPVAPNKPGQGGYL